MDQRKCDESGHNIMDSNVVSQTPEKTNEPLHAKFKERGVKHLDIYNEMVELFSSITCSLRLLSLCKKSQTFKNISAQVEVLAKRKFSFRHLAQIKYILPEAIQIDNILVYDKKTLCVEQDLKVALLFDVIEGPDQQSDYIALGQVFDTRLVNFFTAQPEACDIPEATLPEPFNLRSQASLGKTAAEFPEAVGSGGGNRETFFLQQQSPLESTELRPNSADTELLLTSSLLHPAFSPHFSQKTVAESAQNTILLTAPAFVSSAISDDLNNKALKTKQAEDSPADLLNNKGVKSKQEMLPDTCSKSTVNPPIQLISSQYVVSSHSCESPLQKLASPADLLTIETPAQVTPKRSMPSCDNKLKTMTIQDCSSRNIPAKRFIDFSHLDGERSVLDSFGMLTDSYSVLNGDISQDVEVGGNEESNDNVSFALPEKVEGSLGNLTDDRKMSQSESVIDKDISVCLPDLVASIQHIFQTVNSSSITKQELVHKIIMNNLDIIERREIEEQIEHLEKLVPEWICKKLSPGGDIMYKINKVSDLTSIQARVTSST